MTKKDYIAIAKVINYNIGQPPLYRDNENIISSGWYLKRLHYDNLVLDLCNLFKEDNSKFNSNKFKEACNA